MCRFFAQICGRICGGQEASLASASRGTTHICAKPAPVQAPAPPASSVPESAQSPSSAHTPDGTTAGLAASSPKPGIKPTLGNGTASAGTAACAAAVGIAPAKIGDMIITCVHLDNGRVQCTTLAGREIATCKVPQGEDPFGPWLSQEVIKLTTRRAGLLCLTKQNGEIIWREDLPLDLSKFPMSEQAGTSMQDLAGEMYNSLKIQDGCQKVILPLCEICRDDFRVYGEWWQEGGVGVSIWGNSGNHMDWRSRDEGLIEIRHGKIPGSGRIGIPALIVNVQFVNIKKTYYWQMYTAKPTTWQETNEEGQLVPSQAEMVLTWEQC